MNPDRIVTGPTAPRCRSAINPSDAPSGTALVRGQWRTEIFVGDPRPERLFRRSRVGCLREMQAEIDKSKS